MKRKVSRELNIHYYFLILQFFFSSLRLCFIQTFANVDRLPYTRYEQQYSSLTKRSIGIVCVCLFEQHVVFSNITISVTPPTQTPFAITPHTQQIRTNIIAVEYIVFKGHITNDIIFILFVLGSRNSCHRYDWRGQKIQANALALRYQQEEEEEQDKIPISIFTTGKTEYPPIL